MGKAAGFDYSGFSISAYQWPRKAGPLVSGSGIYPHIHTINYLSQPQCSPPGEFVPRESVLKKFANKETCFEYFRRYHALGWTTNPLGEGFRLPKNPNWRLAGTIAFFITLSGFVTQWWYSNAVHYPKSFNANWAEAEVLHPRLHRSHLQRQDYAPYATLANLDVRWPRWEKLEN